MRLLNEDNERLVIADYSHPAIEGTNVSFSCPPGLALSVSMCMGNGEWEPDPSQVRCNGKDRSTQCNMPCIQTPNTCVHVHTHYYLCVHTKILIIIAHNMYSPTHMKIIL